VPVLLLLVGVGPFSIHVERYVINKRQKRVRDGDMVLTSWPRVCVCGVAGVAVYPNGSRYAGGWTRGKHNGFGVFTALNVRPFLGIMSSRWEPCT
jgi:hypothetical protein